MDIIFKELDKLPIQKIFGPEQQQVTNIAYDSRDASAHSAFFCVQGEMTDGHLYIEEAVAGGATAIFGTTEKVLAEYARRYAHITFLLVENTKEALAAMSIHLSGHVQDRLFKVGVTGTNGKTTTAAFASDLLSLLGKPCGFIGTTGIRSSRTPLDIKKSTPTTPMSPDIHQAFSLMAEQGDEAVAMEVTSIALDQKRVSGIVYDVAIHTNISEEHLEYHGTFERYLQAKLQLFKQAKGMVINKDDSGMSGPIASIAKGDILTYSAFEGSGADLIWSEVRPGNEGTTFSLTYEGCKYAVEVSMFGVYNIGNLAAAAGAALLAGYSMEEIVQALPRMSQVEGRFQLIPGPENRKIILDYAHTPVAIKAVLDEVKNLPHNRLIALIAGIGIRDFGKMPKMAKASEGKADVIVVTVDHPGDHNPEIVVNEVMKGFTIPYKQEIIKAFSRKEAVEAALAASGAGDIVLLSSGCINGAQIIKGEYIPHSDEAIIEDFFLAKS